MIFYMSWFLVVVYTVCYNVLYVTIYDVRVHICAKISQLSGLNLLQFSLKLNTVVIC